MPYKNINDLPEQVKSLPSHAKEIFLSAFNASYEKYGEERAFATAWAAVKNKYKKDGDKWVEKSANESVDLFAPICKIDPVQQMVYGFATGGDLIDTQFEVVDWDATQNALKEYKALKKKLILKEMHRKETNVGSVPACISDNEYKRAWIGAKVEDPNVWAKVESGEYQGFSIGGTNVMRKMVYHPELQFEIPHVVKYDLEEVSLVTRGAYPASKFMLAKADVPEVPKELIDFSYSGVEKMENKKEEIVSQEVSLEKTASTVEVKPEPAAEVAKAVEASQEVAAEPKEIVKEAKPAEETIVDKTVVAEVAKTVEPAKISEEMITVKKSEYDAVVAQAALAKKQDELLDLIKANILKMASSEEPKELVEKQSKEVKKSVGELASWMYK